MKKYYVFAAAALTLASCSNDDLLNPQNSGQSEMKTKAITFGSTAPNITRGTVIGSSAASKLNNHFVVYGTKHINAEDATAANDLVVYNMYQVAYTDNTAGTSESNTNNWEYVGNTAYSSAVTGPQTIKYWDLSAANGYTFYAFSSIDISYPADPTNDKVVVEKITSATDVYKKGFTVTVKNGANLNNVFYADRLPVAKNAYGDPVTFTFRSMGSKIRVGFYETIPGYSVKINKFYYEDNATSVTNFAAMKDTDPANFQAAVQNVGVPADGSSNVMTVEYYDNTIASTENRPSIKGNSGVTYQYNLKLGSNLVNTELGTSSTSCTWDKTGGEYSPIDPNEDGDTPMLIRCDYTLTSTDGSNEVIEVKNARVVVPVQYVQWKSNYAYTYIFKISDKSNGTTGTFDPTDPSTDPDDPNTYDKEGLFPITFDAVIVETDENAFDQETITSVASNSITTYQNGKAVTTYNEYRPGDIYVVDAKIADDHKIIAPTAIGEAATEVRVVEVTSVKEGISEATVMAKLLGGKNDLVFTPVAATLVDEAPASNGSTYQFGTNGAVKFTAEPQKVYAYIYCTTEYVEPTYSSATAYSVSETYYYKEGSDYLRASAINAENFESLKANLYIKSDAGVAGVYDVKVIRVSSLGEAAQEYTYSDYTYNASSIKTVGNTITFTYTLAAVSDPSNFMNDLARFLGAMYRNANVQEITEDFTAGATTTYTWNASLNLKGSNWYDAAGDKTLISTLTAWYATQSPAPTSIVLNLDGVATTFALAIE